MKRFLLNTLIFLLLGVGSLFILWDFLQEPILTYFTHVTVEADAFEYNLEIAQETANWDSSEVSLLDARGLLPYINEEVFPIGELIIPSIDLRLPILLGPTHEHMSLGAATYHPHQQMGTGNYVLASHALAVASGMLFSSLYQVEVGDLMILRDQNYVYVYETFIANKTIGGYRVDILDEVPGQTYLTLFTCPPDVYETDNRILVRGEFVKQISVDDLMQTDGTFAIGEDQEAPLMTLDVQELLQPEEPDFPVTSMGLLIGVPLLSGVLGIWLTNRKPKKR